MKDAAAPAPALDSPARSGAALATGPLGAGALVPVTVPFADAGADMPSSLPRDHPAWQRDVLAVSARVRAVVGRLRPTAVRVLTFWDHLVRGVSVGGRRVEVDVSGCYRVR